MLQISYVLVWPALQCTVVEVEAVGAGGDARVGALIEVKAGPA